METLRCRQKQDEVTSGVLIVAPSGQKGFFYFDRVKPRAIAVRGDLSN